MNKQFGHYEVQCELGRGGMGVVYKAWEPSLNRHVAIKVLGEHLLNDEAVRERFVREAKSMAALNSPHIIQIYYIGEEDGRPYFAMEYIEGQPLSDLLKENTVLSVDHAREILRQCAKGLAAAHDAGVIHRDIKPANIMITNEGLVKIADFGIARTRELGDKLTNTGEFVGTPGYLSPEVCIGQEVDARADIFSLGIVFYEMLAGGMPFNNDSPLGLMLEVVQAEIPDIRQINKQVDRKTSLILQKMIAKSADDRYQHCREIVADLGPGKSQLNLKQIEAQRQPAPSRAAKVTGGLPTGDIPTAPALAALTGSHTQLATSSKKHGRSWLAAATLFVVIGAAAAGYYTGYLPMPFNSKKNQPAVMLAGDNQPPIMTGDETTGNNTQVAHQDHSEASPLFSGLMAVMDEGNETNNQASDQKAVMAQTGETTLDASLEDFDPQAPDTDAAPAQKQVSLLPAGPAIADTATASHQANPSATYEDAVKNTPSRPIVVPSLDKMGELAEQITENAGQLTDNTDQLTRNITQQVANIDTRAITAAANRAVAASMIHTRTTPKPKAATLDKGVVVLAFGDPAVANPIEKTIESELQAKNIKVFNEQFIPGFSKLLEEGADLARLRQAITQHGGQALVIANINSTGTQQLSYYGRQSTLYNAQLDVDGYDLRTGESIAGYGNTLSYTSLNATEKATEAVMPFMDRLAVQVKKQTAQ